MALPVSLSGLSTAVSIVGPFKAPTQQYAAVQAQSISNADNEDIFAAAAVTAAAQTFVASSSFQPVQVKLNLQKVGAPTDNLYVEIRDGSPSGTLLATSNNVAATGISTSQADVAFTFASPPSLASGSTYAIVLRRTGSVDASNYFRWYGAFSNVITGQRYRFDGSSWIAGSTNDFHFSLEVLQDAFYFFGRDGTTATTLQAFKSTAPDTSWSSVATNTGFSTAVQYIAGYQDGNTIHLAVIDGSGTSVNLKYRTFNMATDAFVTSETVQSAFNPQTSGNANVYSCSIVFRASDSQPIILYNGARVASMGSSYSRVVYARRTGTNTWTTNVAVDAGGQSNGYVHGTVVGSSNRVHFFWYMDSTGQSLQRVLNSSNSLQTAASFSSGSSSSVLILATSYNDAGTQRIAAPLSETDIAAIYFDSSDIPTVNRVSSGVSSSGGVARGFNDNGDVYALYVDGLDTDVKVRKSTDDGVSYGSANTSLIAFVNQVETNLSRDAAIYLRGSSYVIPYVVNDNGTLKYNEYVVRSLGSTFDKSVTISAGAAVVGQRSAGKRPSVSSASSTVAYRGVAKSAAPACGGAVATVKRPGKFASASASSTVTALASRLYLAVLFVAAATSVVATRQAGKIAQSVSSAAATTSRRTIAKAVSAIGASVASTSKLSARSIAVTAASAAGATKRVNKVVALASTAAVSVATSFAYLLAVAVSVASSIARAKSTSKTSGVVSAATILAQRHTSKQAQISAASVVAAFAVFAFIKAIAVSVGTAVSARRAASKLLSVGATAVAVVSRGVSAARPVAAGVSVASLRLVSKSTSLVVTGVVLALRVQARLVAIGVAIGSFVQSPRAVSRLLWVVVSGSVSADFVRRFVMSIGVAAATQVAATKSAVVTIANGAATQALRVFEIGITKRVSVSNFVAVIAVTIFEVLVLVASSSAVALTRSLMLMIVGIDVGAAVSAIAGRGYSVVVNLAVATSADAQRYIGVLLNLAVQSATAISNVLGVVLDRAAHLLKNALSRLRILAGVPRARFLPNRTLRLRMISTMYVQSDFADAEVGESEPYGFDFVRDLPSGETIASAIFELSVASGVDASPAAHLIGSPVTNGTKVSQRIEGMAAGARYKLRCVITTSAGNKRALHSFVKCVR